MCWLLPCNMALALMARMGCLQSPGNYLRLSKQFSDLDVSESSHSWSKRSASGITIGNLLALKQNGWLYFLVFSLMLQLHVPRACPGRRGLLQQTESQIPCCWGDSHTPPKWQQYMAIPTLLSTLERQLPIFQGTEHKVNSQCVKPESLN